MRTTVSFAATGLLVVALLTGCSRKASEKPAEATPPPTVAQVAADWPAFVDSFIEARFKADPYFAVQAGRHEFDGKMPDWSRARGYPRLRALFPHSRG